MSRIPLLLLWAALLASPPCRAEAPLPFSPGERFVYDISWSHFLTAGEGVLAVTGQTVNATGDPLYQITFTGVSVGFVAALYPVTDVTQALFDPVRRRSVSCVITIKENDYRKVKRIRFDRERNVAFYQVDDDPEEEFEIGPDTQGPIAALYAVRAMRDRMKPGSSVSVSIFDDRERYELAVHVVRKEILDLPFGMIPTIVVDADLKTEGVFRHKGKMTVWFSDDAVMAPVQMRTKIAIGSIYSTMRAFSGAHIAYTPHPTPTPTPEPIRRSKRP